MAVTAAHGELSDAQHSAELRKAVIAATVGTTECYDFFIHGTAAELMFPKLFFRNEDPLTGTLAAFGTYFIGFAGRPIGAAIGQCVFVRLVGYGEISIWACSVFQHLA